MSVWRNTLNHFDAIQVGLTAHTTALFGAPVFRHTVEQAILDGYLVDYEPLPEQKEIVRRVEGLFALADQLEERLAKARGQVEKLTPPSSPAPSPANSSPKTPPTNQQRNCWSAFEAS